MKHSDNANAVHVDAVHDPVRTHDHFSEILVADFGDDTTRAGPNEQPLGSSDKTIDVELRIVFGVAGNVGANGS